jgi:hypothetical protein
MPPLFMAMIRLKHHPDLPADFVQDLHVAESCRPRADGGGFAVEDAAAKSSASQRVQLGVGVEDVSSLARRDVCGAPAARSMRVRCGSRAIV